VIARTPPDREALDRLLVDARAIQQRTTRRYLSGLKAFVDEGAMP